MSNKEYNDSDNFKKDCETINDIHSRQGTQFLFDVIAHGAADAIVIFGKSDEEAQRFIDQQCERLADAIKIRIAGEK